MTADNDKTDYVEFLQTFREKVSNSASDESKTVSDVVDGGWGYDHCDELFDSMAADQAKLKSIMREAIAEPVDLKSISCLFIRYTCFKFFDRFGISFWRSSQLLEIAQNEVVDYFSIMEVRALFGEQIIKSLFEKFTKENPNGSIQTFSNCCADYGIKNSEQRKTILQEDFAKPSGKRLFIHFFKKKDLGILKKPLLTSTNGAEIKTERKRTFSSPSPPPNRTPPSKISRLSNDGEPARRSLRKQQQNEKYTEDQDVFIVVGNDGEQRIVDFDSDGEFKPTKEKKFGKPIKVDKSKSGEIKSESKIEQRSPKKYRKILPKPDISPDLVSETSQNGAESDDEDDEMPELSAQVSAITDNGDKKLKSYSKKKNRRFEETIDEVAEHVTVVTEPDEDQTTQQNALEELSGEDGIQDIPEIPAFSLEDLKHFEKETDPYAVYALTFACFERDPARMKRVADVLMEERKQASCSDCDEEDVSRLETLSEKLRTFMGFFVPKNYPLTVDKINDMTIDELCEVDLLPFGKACEDEFSRLLEDKRRQLRDKFDFHFNKMKDLFVRFVQKYQPDSVINENMNVKEMEQLILQSLSSENVSIWNGRDLNKKQNGLDNSVDLD